VAQADRSGEDTIDRLRGLQKAAEDRAVAEFRKRLLSDEAIAAGWDVIGRDLPPKYVLAVGEALVRVAEGSK
jgi:hypothetical protein